MIDTIIRNFTLERIGYILKKCIFIAILTGGIGAGLAGMYGQTKSAVTYRAKVSFYLYSKSDYMVESDAYVSSGDFNYAKNLIDSYIFILKSESVLNKVIENLNLEMSSANLSNRISSSSVEGTTLFYIYVSHSDPYMAMSIANSIAEVAPEAISGIVKSGGISVVDYASLPTIPSSTTNILKFILIGAVGGFGIVVAIFMFFGLIDDTIRKKGELSSVFDIPVLGEIPYINVGKKGAPSKVISAESPFAVLESYNSLCANLLFTTKGEKCPVYAVTSSLQNEGKTLTSINIAKTLAGLGKRTLLIDADFRNPSVGKCMGDDEEKNGLSHYLAGIGEKIAIKNESMNFDIVLAGKCPPNPTELIAGTAFSNLVDELKKQYDFIIIDMPPIGIVSDALLVKDMIVGYLLVVRSGVTKMNGEKEIVRKFEAAEANITGYVFNAVDAKSREYSYMKYSYKS